MRATKCEHCKEALVLCTCYDECEYCEGTGEIIIDPAGPLDNEVTSPCVCQAE